MLNDAAFETFDYKPRPFLVNNYSILNLKYLKIEYTRALI